MTTSSIHTLTQLLRTHVCQHCEGVTDAERRQDPTQPAACEHQCPLFQQLKTLNAYAERMDPMVGSFKGVVQSIAAKVKHAPSPATGKCPLERFETEIADVLAETARRNAATQTAGRRRKRTK